MKIFFPTKGIFDGCMYYRIDPYVQVCQQLGFQTISAIIRDLTELIKIGKFDPSQFDLFIMHSPMSLDEYNVFAYIKNAGKPILLDYDDLIWNMPPHWANQTMYYPAVYNASVACLMNADYITVSTNRLKSEIENMFNPPAFIQVIENGVHPSLVEKATWNKPDGKTKVLWRGNDSKLGDLYLIKDVIKPYDGIDWMWFGVKPWFLLKQYGGQFDWLTVFTSVPFERYISELCNRGHGYGLAPLMDHLCNQCKSNVAWLENVVAGAVTIVPQGLAPYDDVPALEYDDSDELECLLSNLHEDDAVGVFELAKLRVLEYYDVTVINKQRVRALEQAVGALATPGGM